ncbi:MAG: acetylxylan esterase [Bacteroidota bacterium]|nr:acetylxylan esterase [Bacteroidota bacterium]
MGSVLKTIENRYHVKLLYEEKNVKNKFVTYADWRFRDNLEATLTNILMPLDMVFMKKNDTTYAVNQFEYFRKPFEEGKKHLDRLLASYPNLQAWEKRKTVLRQCILENMNLWPIPRKTPLNPVYTPKRVMNGYTVENVAIETLPGVYLCGSLYRPSKGKGPFPAMLCPHGHFYNKENNMIMDERGRYRPDQQYRCAMLARMGAVVFSYDMFGNYGESVQVDKTDHRTGLALTMQTLNSMRVIDFLTSLKYVDTNRIGVTAASGGGTQTMIITALDDRITLSVPVVMVSSHFFGGCPCESGLPIHSCTDLGTNNAEFAAMAAPRPQLVISDGDDWTQTVPVIEFPYLQKVYGLYNKPNQVENVHLALEGHDYGISKRMAMYGFVARHFKLNINAVKDKNGKIDESQCTIEKHQAMQVFNKNGVIQLPANALNGADAIRKVLIALQ